MPIYDDFSSAALDLSLWNAVRPSRGFERGALPLDGEPGLCRMRLLPRDGGSDEVLESVLVSTRTWDIGRDPLYFSSTLAVAAEGNEGAACAAFGVFDAQGGTVIGVASTGERLLGVARESGDPLAPLADGALEFTDLGVITAPLRRHDVKIEYDPARRVARWYVDEVLQLYREVPFDPHELTCAFGLLPLRALDSADAPVSLLAQWGPIQYEEESEIEPDPLLA